MDLSKKRCLPCEGDTMPFNQEQIAKYKSLLKFAWEIVEERKISYQFKFKNFEKALKFVNLVGKVAESEKHHPNIYIRYNKVRIDLTTHAIHGLSENDFIMAARIENLV